MNTPAVVPCASACAQALPQEAEGMGTGEILRRLALRRDPTAWGALLERHGTEMLRVSRRILRDEALAEDAVQEALLLIRDRAGQFRGSGPAPARAAREWVLRTAATAALQMLRGRARERRRTMRQAQEQEARNTTDALEASRLASDTEQAETVRLELERLPQAERVPVMLHYYGEMGYPQIAAVLGCPIGTAKIRVHRGVEKLRRRLALLGLIFAASELAAFLKDSAACAAEGGAPREARRMEEWRSLLDSSRKPALPVFAPPKGGVSTMVKIGSGLAALALAGALMVTGMRSQGADAPARPKTRPSLLEASPQGPAAALHPAVEKAPLAAPPKDPAAPATAGERKALAEDNNAFALDLFAKLKAQEKGNLFFSPYSISTALGMTYAGARGKTEAEMAKALRFTLGQDRLHGAMGALIGELNAATKNGKPRGFALSVANSLWGQKGYTFKPEFLTLNKESYGAGLQEADFLKATEAARLAINAWVEQKTKEKIKDLIAEGMLTPATRLVLVNAIYFKGEWEVQFNKQSTRNDVFHLAAGKQAEVPLMNRTGAFKYFEEENRFQLLELPYVNRELSMLVFLPATVEGLTGLEDALTPKNLAQWAAATQSTTVRVSLPKFKLTWGTQVINPQLEALGMKDAFHYPAADFSGLADTREFYIGLVLHKAFVDVNEEGTEAAAATAVVGLKGGARPPSEPKVFRVDRPFIFALRDNATGSILFLGRVLDPR